MSVPVEKLHELVDELAESELPAAQRYLEYLRDGRSDPLLEKLMSAPYDDEPVTEEEEAAVQEAREDIKAGRVVSHEEVRRHLLADS